MIRHPLELAALLLAALAAPALATPEDAPADVEGAAALPATGGAERAAAPGGGVLTVSGKIAAVDLARGRFIVDAPSGPVELQVDRNTGVFLEKRMGTLRSLSAGLPVRACYADPERTAFWVEVHARGVQPGRAALEVKPPPSGPATPPAAEDGDEGAAPPDSGATPPSAGGPEQPGPGRTTPGPKSGG
ncbi:hypothetical protein [Anaeromyxobacter paludicola]|uniref:Uncharacterized protein n=1 Tax=Anaeromyxobacter paludicola TaxID=2918171 RepID=A0ABM7X7I4_9BACT|nr:hypothetical protein [Anaeromyxobacter paludicola]BDG07800.1 hypothetical protein AMPC_09130 [Anaeromyxobacter paludicola]